MYKFYSIFLGAAIALATMVSVSGVASATPIINSPTSVTVFEVGDEFGVDYECTTTEICGDELYPDADMSGMIFFEVTYMDADLIIFAIEIMNTSGDDSPDNRIAQFGIGILDPDTSSGTASSDNTDWTADLDTTFPTFGVIDLVASTTSGSGGVLDGTSAFLNLTISGFASSLLTNGLTLTIFPIKWKGVGDSRGSFEFAGTLKEETREIPEPGTLALFGMGLLGLAAMGRRRRRAA